MRLLLIGDIVGKPGRQIVCRALKPLIERERLDLVVANGENAAGGSGITPAIYHELIAAGVDVVTLGDHIYRRVEVIDVLRTETNIVKPANFPAEAPGKDFTTWDLPRLFAEIDKRFSEALSGPLPPAENQVRHRSGMRCAAPDRRCGRGAHKSFGGKSGPGGAIAFRGRGRIRRPVCRSFGISSAGRKTSPDAG